MGAWPEGGVASPLGAFGELHVDALAVDVQGGVQGLQHLQQLRGFLWGTPQPEQGVWGGVSRYTPPTPPQ